jgi:hypothetical protein
LDLPSTRYVARNVLIDSAARGVATKPVPPTEETHGSGIIFREGDAMMSLSRRSLVAFCSLALCGVLFPSAALAFDIEIDVAPNVLNIQSESVVVTVHTNIAYSSVVGSTVFMNGVAISHWKADARGNFVAKFLSDEIKSLDGLKIDDYNTLTLTGYTTDGEAFIGSQDIKVIDVSEKGKN